MRLIPDGPYQEHVDDIVQCEWDDVVETGLADVAGNELVDEPDTHVGQGDVWFKHVDDVGFCGLWEPGNRPGTLRFAPVFVAEEARGQGIGRAMVLKRFRYALDRPDIDRVDTYAYNPRFFHELGWEFIEHYEGEDTYYLAYTKD